MGFCIYWFICGLFMFGYCQNKEIDFSPGLTIMLVLGGGIFAPITIGSTIARFNDTLQ